MSEIIRSYGHVPEAMTVQRGDGSSRKIRGVASVTFDGTPGTEYGLAPGVVERIAPGAFDHLLGDDVIGCVDHDGKLIVGRNGANMKLWTTARGLEYEIDLTAGTSAQNDLWANVRAGIIRGSSFRADFTPGDKQAVEWSRSGKMDILTIKRFDKLRDVAMVHDAAYKATDVSAIQRSLEQHLQHEETFKRLARLLNIQHIMVNLR